MQQHMNAANYYDNLAEFYDQATSLEGAWNAPSEARNALTLISKRDTALIIGIGTGYDVEGLIECNFSKIEGVDVSRKMLAICKNKYPKVILHHGDFLSEKLFNDTKYDLIICSGTSEFIENIDLFFSKSSSLLYAKGAMIFTFEPQIFNHKIQFEKESILTFNSSSKFNDGTMKIYRRNIKTIFDIALTNTFKVIHQYEYVSYQKAGIDIVYQLIVFEKY